MTVRVRTIELGTGIGEAVLGMAVLPKETEEMTERSAIAKRGAG
jgi:hypothetical protein